MSGVAANGEAVVTFEALHAADPVFIVDMQQCIVAWNSAAESLLGHRAQDVLGARCYEVMTAHGANSNHICSEHCPVIANAARGRPIPSVETMTTTHEGEPRWVAMGSLVARSTSGHRRVVHWLRDMTRYHDLEDTMTRAISHTQRATATPAPDYAPPREQVAPPASPIADVLTRREVEVLRLLVRGLSTSQMAATLGISPLTARNHVTNVMTKLGAGTRLQAVVRAAEAGLL